MQGRSANSNPGLPLASSTRTAERAIRQVPVGNFCIPQAVRWKQASISCLHFGVRICHESFYKETVPHALALCRDLASAAVVLNIAATAGKEMRCT